VELIARTVALDAVLAKIVPESKARPIEGPPPALTFQIICPVLVSKVITLLHSPVHSLCFL
jgi:hypothetical protein